MAKLILFQIVCKSNIVLLSNGNDTYVDNLITYVDNLRNSVLIHNLCKKK